MLGPSLLAASQKPRVRRVVTTMPLSRQVVDRFVAGESLDEALRATRELTDAGMTVTIDHLGEDTTSLAQAEATREAYVQLLAVLGEAGLADRVEVSLKLSAMGQALSEGGDDVAYANARLLCEAAQDVGTTVTLDMEDHTTVDSTLAILRKLRVDFPWVGAVLQTCLHRTEADCRELAHEGSRVRLVKGAYAEPATVAHPKKADVDLAYVRCLKVLMNGDGYPMVATHDKTMIAIAEQLAAAAGRDRDSFEFQMLYGVRRDLQQALVKDGWRMRVYIPFGTEWYPYLMRRLAERPANAMFILKNLFR